jgi:hypothetical protein
MLILPIKKKWFDMILSGEKMTFSVFVLTAVITGIKFILEVAL